MVIMSVQLCVGIKVLKGWGLHPLNERASLAEVLGQFVVWLRDTSQFASGDMEGSSAYFALPEDLRDQLYERFLAPSATGPFQTAFPSAKVGEVLDSSINGCKPHPFSTLIPTQSWTHIITMAG